MNPARCANCEIWETVVVIIARRTSCSALRRTNAELLRNIFELPFSEVVKKGRSSERPATSQKQIDSAVIVIIDETSGGTSIHGQPRALRPIHKPHRNRRPHLLHRHWRLFRARILSLFAI